MTQRSWYYENGVKIRRVFSTKYDKPAAKFTPLPSSFPVSRKPPEGL